MFVCQQDFDDWQEEQTILELEHDLTHRLDFLAWEAELLTADPEGPPTPAPPSHRPPGWP